MLKYKFPLLILSSMLLISASGIICSNNLPNLSETDPPIEYMEVPSYVNQEANFIHYKEQLKDFYDKLAKLKRGEIDKVNILHIGDSHLQAGILPGELRYLLQATYGNAGRGLVFPYQLVKTNGPYDFNTRSNIEWECSRNIAYNQDFPVGLCGYSLRTNKKQFEVEVKLRNKEDHFNKITVLGSTDSIFDLKLKSLEADGMVSFDKIPFKSGSCFILDEPKTAMVVSGVKPDNQLGNYIMQGLILENTNSKGILYSCTAVNGATYYSYNRSEKFMEQLGAIEPDLVIISLGSNEAAVSVLHLSSVEQQMMYFLDNLKKHSNCKSVLVVSPGDLFLRGVIRTKNSFTVTEMMHDIAKVHRNIAVWDFYEVMGGFGSIEKWFNSKLAAYDRSHFSALGYKLQAQLLFKALMNSVPK